MDPTVITAETMETCYDCDTPVWQSTDDSHSPHNAGNARWCHSGYYLCQACFERPVR